MSKSIQIDLSIAIPTIVAFIGFITFLINQIVRAKDSTIESQRKDIDSLEKDIKELREKILEKENEISNFDNLIQQYADDMDKRGVDSTQLRHIRQNILSSFEELKYSKSAARWLNVRRANLRSNMMKYACEQCPDELNSRTKRHDFGKDIDRYIDWLHDSLTKGFHQDRKKYIQIKDHAIDSVFPYRAALQLLYQTEDFGQLNNREISCIRSYAYDLCKKISG